MFLSWLYWHTATGAWASHFYFGPYFLPVKPGGEMNSVVLKPVLTESYGNLLQSTDAQAQNRTIKSESLEGKALAFVFYKISTLDSIV